MSEFSQSFEEAPLKAALDKYYAFAIDLIEPSAHERVAINNTILSMDLDEKARLYNEGLFRKFADRCVQLSPTEWGSIDLGERYSDVFGNMILQVLRDVDRAVQSDKYREEIKALQRDLAAASKEWQTELKALAEAWRDYATAAGLDPKDPLYMLKRNTFLTKSGGLARDLARQVSDVERQLFILRDAQLDAELKPLLAVATAVTQPLYKLARPDAPFMEIGNGLNEIQLAEIASDGAMLGDFDIGQIIKPVGDLTKLFTRTGTHEMTVTKSDTYKEQHDRDWKVSGSGRKMFFFKASVSAEYHESLKKSLEEVESIKISYANVEEKLVERRHWYRSDVFGLAPVRKYLKEQPRVASRLNYLVTSLVIGRGITVTMKFTSKASLEVWKKMSISGRGGVSIAGFNLGVSGHHTKYDWNYQTNDKETTVNIVDSDNHCRLVGVGLLDLGLLAPDSKLRGEEFRGAEELLSPEASPADTRVMLATNGALGRLAAESSAKRQ